MTKKEIEELKDMGNHELIETYEKAVTELVKCVNFRPKGEAKAMKYVDALSSELLRRLNERNEGGEL